MTVEVRMATPIAIMVTLAPEQLDALADRIVDRLVASQPTEDTCDQDTLPPCLHRKRYLEAVRRGEIPAAKVHRRVICKKVDLDAWIARHAVRVVDETPDDGIEHDLAVCGLKLRK